MDINTVNSLPPYWACASTPDGRIFFIDEQRRQTTWLHPLTNRPVQSGFTTDPGLPEGWELGVNDQGKFIYVNHLDGIIHANPPPGVIVGEEPVTPAGDADKLNRSDLRRRSSKKKKGPKSAEKPPMPKRNVAAEVKIQGWLYKQEGGLLKLWKKKYCVVSDYCFFCYEDDDQHEPPVAAFILLGYTITVCDSEDTSSHSSSRKFIFKVEHEKAKTYHFAADRDSDRAIWVAELTKAATLKDDGTLREFPLGDGSNLRRYSNQDLSATGGSPHSPNQTGLQLPGAGWPVQSSPRPGYGQSHGQQAPRNYGAEGYPENQVVLRRQPQDTGPPRQTVENPYPFREPESPSRPTNLPGVQRNTDYYPGTQNRPDGPPRPQTFAPQSTVVSGNPDELYAKVVKHPPSAGQQAIRSPMVSDPRDISLRQPPTGDPRMQAMAGSDTTYSIRSDAVAARSDNRYRQTVPYDPRYDDPQDPRQSGPTARDHNFNVSKDSMPLQQQSGQPRSPADAEGFSSFRSRDQAGSTRVISRGERHIDGTPMFGDPTRVPPQSSVSPGGRPGEPQRRGNEEQYFQFPDRAAPPQQQSGNKQTRDYDRSRPESQRQTADGQLQQPGYDAANGRYYDGPEHPQNGYLPNSGVDVRDFGSSRGVTPLWRDDNQVDRMTDRSSIRNAGGLRPAKSQNSLRSERPGNGVENDPNWKAQMHDEFFPEGRASAGSGLGTSRQQSYADLRGSREAARGIQRQESRSLVELRTLNGNGFRDNPAQNGIRDPDMRSRQIASPHATRTDPRHQQQPAIPRGFDAIKEDPDMSDSDLLKSRTLDQLRKHLSGHARLRLSISTQELVGKSHEELVLLLIQLRRSQTKLEEMRVWLRDKLNARRPDERTYKFQRENSTGRVDESLEQRHRYFLELQKEAAELDKQLETTQPLINLLDNIVTMGSLYGGDNLLYASEYKRHQLPPGQSAPTKNMIEFSRRHQEEQLAQKQKQSMRRLTDDEMNLEERLQQLYRLDRVVQERSFNVTSLQEDKAVLEKSLDEVQRSEQFERDPLARERLAQRRQIVEQELSRVRQQLADASRLLEEVSTENAKVEQEVVILRNKVYGVGTSSNAHSQVVAGSSQAVVRMEQELNQVRTMMQGLSNQGSSLSETMRGLKPPSPKPLQATSSGGTYLETDLDRSTTRNIATRGRPANPPSQLQRGLSYPGPSDRETVAPRNQPVERGFDPMSRSGNLNATWSTVPPESHLYRGGVAPLSRQDSRTISGGHFPPYRGRGPQETLLARAVPSQRQQPAADPRLMYGPRRTGSQEELRPSNNYTTGARNADMTNGGHHASRQYKSMREPRNPETSYNRESNRQDYTDSGLSELRRVNSLPKVGQEQDLRSSQPPYSGQRKEQPAGNNAPSAVDRLFQSYPRAPTNGIDGNRLAGHQPPPALNGPRYVSTATFGTSGGGPAGNRRAAATSPGEERSNFDRWRNMTVSSSHPSAHELQQQRGGVAQRGGFGGNAPPVKTRSVDDLVKSEASKPLEFDDDTIDRELLGPRPVEIPERYDPESSSEEEFVTEEDRQLRWEKKEKYKRMLAAHSLQDFTAGELPPRDGPVHELVDDEMKRREQLLDIKQQLAQEVTQKSKVAAMRRKSNPNIPESFNRAGSDHSSLIGYVPMVD